MKSNPTIVLAIVAALVVPVAGETSRPNILLILSDDQGYADAGFQGSREIVTPHLDSLAKSGVRCTNGYVTHSVCSPSRAGILTGRYQARCGHERNPRWLPEDHDEGLPTSETLFPALLAKAGYATGWIGKWHLGAAPEFHPEKRGFTDTFGFLGGGHNYPPKPAGGPAEYDQPILRDGKPVAMAVHLTTAFGHEAATFVTRHREKPWFLYLAFNAPHTPHQPTAERLERFKNIADPKRRAYAAQISLMDDAIGETLTALRKTGQLGRTLVFFMSDNGGPQGQTDNFPLRGWKGSFYEGGVHVPFLVSWPGRLPTGKDYPGMVSALDVAATALAEAGVEAPTDKPLDGVNLIPFLAGKQPGSPHDHLFWRRTPTNYAVATPTLKLVRAGTPGTFPELYDLSKDPGEKTDLAATHPEKTKTLLDAAAQWSAQMSKDIRFPGLGTQGHGPRPFGTLDCGESR